MKKQTFQMCNFIKFDAVIITPREEKGGVGPVRILLGLLVKLERILLVKCIHIC